MDWSQVLYAGIGGGVGGGSGALIASLINRKVIKNPKYHGNIVAAFTAGLAVLGMNFSKSMYKNMTLPRLNTSIETQILESSPIYTEMKLHEPEYFNKIIQNVDESLRGDMNKEVMINSSRKILQELLMQKLQYADSKTLTITIEITRQNYLDYKNSKPFLCTQLINKRGLGDVTNLLSEKSQELEQKYMMQLIRLPHSEQQAFSTEMAQQSLQQMTEKMTEFMEPSESIDPAKSADIGILKRVCDIGVKDMDLILELPDKERANYIKYSAG